MSFDDLLIHSLAIERATSGSEDDYGQPVRIYATVTTFRGRLTSKSVREVAQLNQAGAVVSDYTLHTRPRGLGEADRIRFDPDDGRRFEIVGLRLISSSGPHHLEADLRLVEAG